jgi:hypothetical protein
MVHRAAREAALISDIPARSVENGGLKKGAPSLHSDGATMEN